jgi:hypothetical protein
MHLPSYEIVEKADDYSEYKFVSVGPNGSITKFIVFKRLFVETLYNLSLLDVMPDGTYSDTHFSNNNDLRKILATILEVVIDYTEKFPDRQIFFQGSDEEGKRISLYHKAISKHLFVLEKEFHIYGIADDGQEERFNPDSRYSAVLVMRK